MSVRVVRREMNSEAGVYTVEVEATTPDGRVDFASGVVPISKERGEWREAKSGKRYFAGDGTYTDMRGVDLANALMKAETKAKRRATLSICGLGWMDETELDTTPARPVTVDASTGEIVSNGTKAPPAKALPPPTVQLPAGWTLETHANGLFGWNEAEREATAAYATAEDVLFAIENSFTEPA